jgi:TRAP-type C4-dicarboxylate transport system substrate-binding protein
VQKFIVLTGHITDALITIVGGPTWNKLADADKKVFEDVLKEAAARATGEIVEIEKKLGAEFEKRGRTVVKVDRTPFREAVVKMHNGPDATWDRATYDKLQALK